MIQYRGYQYEPWTESESDNQKTYHDCRVIQTGQLIPIDWSPYQSMSEKHFKLWIDLGMPPRRGTGPLSEIDLLALAEIKWGADFLKELGDL